MKDNFEERTINYFKTIKLEDTHNNEPIYYVYLDKTDDGRYYYGGKGRKQRTGVVERNPYWQRIRNKYGWTREIVYATKDENHAFEIEIELIKKHKTFEPDWEKGEGWGANLSRGGEGPSGFKMPPDVLIHLAALRRGQKRTEEFKIWLSEARKGAGNPAWGTKHSKEHKAKIAHSLKDGNQSSLKKGHTNTPRGENHPLAIVSEHQVREIKYILQTTDWSCREIGEIYGLRRQLISAIKFGYSWTHINWFFPIILNAEPELMESKITVKELKRKGSKEKKKNSKPKQKAFHLCIDWTKEEIPRAYYVSVQTTDKALYSFANGNEIWLNTKKEFGRRREIFLSTYDEEFAYEMQKQKIQELGTFNFKQIDGTMWGANFTPGGKGVSGLKWTEEQKEARRGENNPSYGRVVTDEQKEVIRKASTGRTHSDETRKKLSKQKTGEGNPMFGLFGEANPNFGKKASEDTLKKISGANASNARLNNKKVAEIRLLITQGQKDQKIGDLYQVDRKTISVIRTGKTWKE